MTKQNINCKCKQTYTLRKDHKVIGIKCANCDKMYMNEKSKKAVFKKTDTNKKDLDKPENLENNNSEV